jgi:DNA mismatch repair ATPase MutS
MSIKKFESALYVALGFIILWLFLDREEKKEEIAELKHTIDENENLNEAIKKQLKDLIQNNQDIDPQIASELGQIAALIEIQHESGAILKLAKIIENLMGQLYKPDSNFKNWLKGKNKPKAVFADYIEFAKLQNDIDPDDYHILGLMKNIRNEEAHQLDVKKDKTKILVSFVSGMSLILGLSKLIKLKALLTPGI